MWICLEIDLMHKSNRSDNNASDRLCDENPRQLCVFLRYQYVLEFQLHKPSSLFVYETGIWIADFNGILFCSFSI